MAFGSVKPPAWFWIFAILALLWSLGGCFACYSQITISDEAFAKLPVAQQAVWKTMPGWVTADYAIAVLTSTGGSLGLLLRQSWARPLFVISLIAVVIQFGWVFLFSPVLKTVGPSALPFPLLIAVLGALFIWFAGLSIRRGWLR